MPYVDYTYYTQTFLGSLVPEADFPRVERKAAAYLGQALSSLAGLPEAGSGGTSGGPSAEASDGTGEPAAGETAVPLSPAAAQALRDALCALCELEYQEEQRGAGVLSERAGEYQVDWESQKDAGARRYGLVCRYLGRTGLMWAGV